MKVEDPAKQAMSVAQRVVFAANAADVRTETLRGQEHIVVPCVMLNEGVLHSSNAEHPALALASEFGAVPEGWDGRPVVYNHPEDENGQPVSANRPQGWDSGVIGYVFNTKLDGTKLRSELWVDTSRAPEVVISGLKDGTEFEVSTGLFATPEESSGVFQNEQYSEIWRNVVPDHLAILEPGSIGACSIADGCGTPRNNALRTQGMYMTKSAQTSGSSGTPSPKTNACGSATTGCKCGGKPEMPANQIENVGIRPMISRALQKLQAKVTSLFMANELSDNDIRTAIQAGLDALDEKFAYPSVHAVFDSYVIFYAMLRDDYDWHLMKVSYSVAEGGAIVIGSDWVEVRPETAYVPVVVSGDTVADPELTASSSPTTTAKESTVDLTQEQLAEVAKQVASTLAANASAAAASTTPVAPAATTAEPQKFETVEAMLANAEAPIADQVKEALAFANATRKSLVDNLVKAGYAEAELATIPLNVLRRMGAPSSVSHVDYSGLGGGNLNANAQPEAFTPPMPVFAAKA